MTTTYYTAAYRAFAKKHKLTCDLLSPFWTIARRLGDKEFDNDSSKPGYWAFVWATMETLVLKMTRNKAAT